MLEIVKRDTSELELGMYVSDLDRPWLETPFLLQGFRISSESEIEQLKELCKHVFIDIKQSDDRIALKESAKPSPAGRKSKQSFLAQREIQTYNDQSTLQQEFPRARSAIKALTLSIEEVFESARKGATLDVPRIKHSVEPMINSISSNPDACIWLAQMKQQDNYTYEHSLATSIWAVALGRQLGLPPEDLSSLAVGGLLLDVGKLDVDQDLLHSDQVLDGDELDAVRRHVTLGAVKVSKAGVNKDIMDMVLYHHERFDGSGYPHQLAGDKIPVFARIAAIVDAFDAMTSHRSYARAMSPSAAISELHAARDVKYQAEIVEEFIQAIGVYPAGTLVELTSGEVGVVVSECRTRRLRPKLMILLDEFKKPLAKPLPLDLRAVKKDSQDRPLDIITSLEPNAYNLDVGGLRL